MLQSNHPAENCHIWQQKASSHGSSEHTVLFNLAPFLSTCVQQPVFSTHGVDSPEGTVALVCDAHADTFQTAVLAPIRQVECSRFAGVTKKTFHIVLKYTRQAFVVQSTNIPRHETKCSRWHHHTINRMAQLALLFCGLFPSGKLHVHTIVWSEIQELLTLHGHCPATFSQVALCEPTELQLQGMQPREEKSLNPSMH